MDVTWRWPCASHKPCLPFATVHFGARTLGWPCTSNRRRWIVVAEEQGEEEQGEPRGMRDEVQMEEAMDQVITSMEEELVSPYL